MIIHDDVALNYTLIDTQQNTTTWRKINGKANTQT